MDALYTELITMLDMLSTTVNGLLLSNRPTIRELTSLLNFEALQLPWLRIVVNLELRITLPFSTGFILAGNLNELSLLQQAPAANVTYEQLVTSDRAGSQRKWRNATPRSGWTGFDAAARMPRWNRTVPSGLHVRSMMFFVCQSPM